ncbi:MAG: hypothetical protein C4542_07505 [Dehalococcoidia bacterium]|nr:MAG: hypothetical protein C4542_07505 [Dehalococcoidia bacterium]
MEDLATLEKKTIDAFMAGDYQKSRDMCYKLIKLAPHDPRYFIHLAECHQKLGELGLAEKCRTMAQAMSSVEALGMTQTAPLPLVGAEAAPPTAASYSGGGAGTGQWAPQPQPARRNSAWIVLSSILAVALIMLGVFYAQGVGKLNDANAHIYNLETQLAEEKATVASLEVQLSAEKATVASLQTQLTAEKANVADLKTRLTASEGKVTSLTADLAAANSKVASTQASLAKAYADLAVSASSLKQVQDPRHFNTLAELQTWLAKDDTNTNPAYTASSSYAKAFILQVKALRDGYLLPACLDWDATYIYSWNAAVVGGVAVSVNASTDVITTGPTFGSPPPSHPLPMP